MSARVITITQPSEQDAFALLLREALRLFDVHLVNLVIAAALVLILLTFRAKWSR